MIDEGYRSGICFGLQVAADSAESLITTHGLTGDAARMLMVLRDALSSAALLASLEPTNAGSS